VARGRGRGSAARSGVAERHAKTKRMQEHQGLAANTREKKPCHVPRKVEGGGGVKPRDVGRWAMEQWWRSQLRRDDGAVDDGWQASGRRRQWVTDCITQITPTY